MPSKRPPRQYPIEWVESPWEESLWRQQQTFHSVLELIETVARERGRELIMDELLPSPQDNHVSFTVDDRGRLALGAIKTSDRRAAVLAHAAQRIMRALAREESARIIRQVDVRDERGTARRTIVVRWDRQRLSTATQIRQLSGAVESRSQFKIERAWFGLTPRAHDYLSVGYKLACRRRELAGYDGELEVRATIIPVLMLSPDLLRLILPYALRAVARPGRRPVHPRDEALAKLFDVFMDVSGHAGAGARRGGRNEPFGPGAEFIRRLETIFGFRLMARSSTHAIARALKRMRQRT